jgi:Ca-activated chloride channel homolog
VVTALVPRLWAGEYARQLMGSGASLDENRSKVLELGLEYGLMTPYTSILALENEQAYVRQGLKRRRSPLRGVKLTAIESDDQERRLAAIFNPLQGPVSMAGCGMRPSSDEAAPAAAPADEKLGGNGTRAKGESYAAQAPAAPAAEQGIATSDTTTSTIDGELASQSQKMSPAPMATAAPGGGQGEGVGLGGLGAGGKLGAKKATGGADLPAAGPKRAEPRPMDPAKEKADKDKAERARQVLAQAQSNAKITVPKRPPARCSDAASRPSQSAS